MLRKATVAKAVKEAAADIPAHAPVALDSDGKLALLTADNKASVYGLAPDSIRAGEEGPVWVFTARSMLMSFSSL